MSVQEHLKALIEEYGWAIQGVFPTEDHPGPYFDYTVGLHLKGLPELVIYGLPHQSAAKLLNQLALKQIEEGPLTPGQRLEDELKNGLDLYTLDATHDHECFQAQYMAKEDITVIQIVWPDQNNKFPWEPDATVYDDQRLPKDKEDEA